MISTGQRENDKGEWESMHVNFLSFQLHTYFSLVCCTHVYPMFICVSDFYPCVSVRELKEREYVICVCVCVCVCLCLCLCV